MPLRVALLAVLFLLLLPLVTLADGGLVPGRPQRAPIGAEVVPGELLVRYVDGLRLPAADGVLRVLGARSVAEVGSQGWQLARFDASTDLATISDQLRRLAFVTDVEPNRLRRVGFVPNDPFYLFGGRPALDGPLWNMPRVQSQTAWDLATGNGVRVGVLDTGFRAGGEDAPASVATGYNGFNGSAEVTDNNGHGTHVAGTLAQRTNNGTGVVGLAFGATLVPIKICGDDGLCSVSAIVNGLAWARSNGVRVTSLSLGGSTASSAEAAEITATLAAGIPVVAAMGNDAQVSNNIQYPAAYPGVIAVGATRFDDSRAAYSNTGSHIWLMAPGGDCGVDQNNDGLTDCIYQQTLSSRCPAPTPTPGPSVTPTPSGGFSYCGLQGTSMATPHVAATVALMLQRAPGLSPGQVRAILRESALPLGGQTGFSTATGWGLLQAQAATQRAAAYASTGCRGVVAASSGAGPVPDAVSTTGYLPALFRACAGGW